ncbi:MAG: dienelactone hydrolase family protein [Flavisolibacter sp.]
MKKIFFPLLFLCISTAMKAQDTSLYERHLYIEKGDTLPYRLLLPKDYDASKKYPLILFLHGSGERGNDNELQLVHGADLFLRDSIRNNYKAIVVFPQCSLNGYWSNVKIVTDSIQKTRVFNFQSEGEPTVAMKLLLSLLNQLPKKYKLDKERIYVGGLSMGGMGTFEIVHRKPKLFAAAFPICGGANAAIADDLKNTAWWIFHGLKDNVVDPVYSKVMAAALKGEGADVKLTLYPDANHNSWDSAFAEKDLMTWLFSKNK